MTSESFPTADETKDLMRARATVAKSELGNASITAMMFGRAKGKVVVAYYLRVEWRPVYNVA